MTVTRLKQIHVQPYRAKSLSITKPSELSALHLEHRHFAHFTRNVTPNRLLDQIKVDQVYLIKSHSVIGTNQKPPAFLIIKDSIFIPAQFR